MKKSLALLALCAVFTHSIKAVFVNHKVMVTVGRKETRRDFSAETIKPTKNYPFEVSWETKPNWKVQFYFKPQTTSKSKYEDYEMPVFSVIKQVKREDRCIEFCTIKWTVPVKKDGDNYKINSRGISYTVSKPATPAGPIPSYDW